MLETKLIQAKIQGRECVEPKMYGRQDIPTKYLKMKTHNKRVAGA